MDPITRWSLSVDGLGYASRYDHEWNYAGGFSVVCAGYGNPNNSIDIIPLGGDLIALREPGHGLYWNSHYNDNMHLWYDYYKFTSDRIGDEQKFRLINKGHGRISLQCAAGHLNGKYVQVTEGGWYPREFGYGKGTVAIGSETSFHVDGDLLPILIITKSAKDLDLSGKNFAGLNLDGADFTNAGLSRTNFSQVQSFQSAKFPFANLQQAIFDGKSLHGADFTNADFTGTDLRKILPSEAQLSHAKLINAQLQDVNLSRSNLTYANFSGAVLDGADLRGADLTGAILTGASLVGTKLEGAIMHNTIFDHCDLTTVTYQYPPDFTRAESGRTSFVQAVVPYKLLGDNWSYLDLSEATIKDIPDTLKPLNANYALLPSGLDLSKKDLQGASFIGSRMYEMQLQGANLERAQLMHTRLKGAKLVGANLSLANLDSAYLISESMVHGQQGDPGKREAAVLTEAFMIDTNLNGAFCDGVDFSGALFMTYAALDPDAKANANGATMNMTKFNKAVLIQADFDNAQLSGSNFGEATLINASFKKAQLTPATQPPNEDASFYKADIRGADCTGANMDGLDMRNAVISTAPGDFKQVYTDYYGRPIPFIVHYTATVLGDTTSGTTCPDGSKGPCHLSLTATGVNEEN